MSAFQEEHIQSILQACGEHAQTLAEGIDRCFDGQHALTVHDATNIDPQSLPALFDEPGLILVIQVGSQAMLGLIPESFPLPEWYTDPDESQASRLQSLGMEWSFALFPEELDAESYAAVAVPNLRAALMEADPAEWGQMFSLQVERSENSDEAPAADESSDAATEEPDADASDAAEPEASTADEPASDTADEPTESTAESTDAAGDTDDAETAATEETTDTATDGPSTDIPNVGSQILLLGPVNRPPTAGSSDEDSSEAPSQQGNPPNARELSSEEKQRRKNLGHINNLEVKVVVRLAEKKIEMGQLLAIAPGALITFNKQCEELLDLYVNNQLYCRGEAVKIGEKFGLKINEVGSVNVREKQILYT